MAEHAKALLDSLAYVAPAQYTTRYYTVRGKEFYQVFQGFPALNHLYMQWEKDYNAEKIYWFIVDNGMYVDRQTHI